MKKLFLFLLIFETAFNLAGGYAIAGTFNQPQAIAKSAYQGHTIVAGKQVNYLQNQLQLFKEEKQDEDLLKCDLTFSAVLPTVFHFVPEFSVCNKHFLGHFAATIKAEMPATYLLGQVFRL